MQQSTDSAEPIAKIGLKLTIEDLYDKIMDYLQAVIMMEHDDPENFTIEFEYWSAGRLMKLFDYLFRVVIIPNVDKWEKEMRTDNGSEKNDKRDKKFQLKNKLSENAAFETFLFYMDSIEPFNYNISYLKKHAENLEMYFENLAYHFYLLIRTLNDNIFPEIYGKARLLIIDEYLKLEFDPNNPHSPIVALDISECSNIFKLNCKGYSLRIFDVKEVEKSKRFKLLDSKWVK